MILLAGTHRTKAFLRSLGLSPSQPGGFALKKVIVDREVLSKFIHLSQLALVVLSIGESFRQSTIFYERPDLLELSLEAELLLLAMLLVLLLQVIVALGRLPPSSRRRCELGEKVGGLRLCSAY